MREGTWFPLTHRLMIMQTVPVIQLNALHPSVRLLQTCGYDMLGSANTGETWPCASECPFPVHGPAASKVASVYCVPATRPQSL